MNRLFQIVCTIACMALSTPTGLSQISEESKYFFGNAEKLLLLEEYKNALPLYLSVLDAEPENANINYRVGQCYISIQGKERESLPYLEKAIKDIDNEYKPGNTNSFGASPYVWFLLGDAYHRDGRLSEASKAYNNYKQYIANDKKELTRVMERIIGLGISQEEIRDHPRDVILSNLGEEINTEYSEYNIMFSGDLKVRVFNRFYQQSHIVFYSVYENGGWTKPIDLTELIGSQGDMYATALSFDGMELYLILLTDYEADIYVSELKDGQWGYANNIGRNINSKYFESNACVLADGNMLYFSSDRPTSIGGFDIFYSKRVDGKWGKAESLGEVINTKSNEESPFITENGNTFYFSSDRPGTMGRMDVFFSRIENENWSAPENLGMPYNSVEDDIAFKYYEKYNKSFIARDLPDGFGKLDLYVLQSRTDSLHELTGYDSSIVLPKPLFKNAVIDTQEFIEESFTDTTLIHLQNAEEDFTVQIMALDLTDRLSNYNGLDTSLIRIMVGTDGFTRFIYGQYKTREEAEKALKIVLSKGYEDAYIRKMSEFSKNQ